MKELVSVLRNLKTLVLRFLSFENVGNKTTTIQNSGSGDVVMGDKHENTMNIHLSPYPSVSLSELAKELLQKIVEKGQVNSNIVLIRTDQADTARIDGKNDIVLNNIEVYLDELSDAGMIKCLTPMRYILLRQGIDFCKK